MTVSSLPSTVPAADATWGVRLRWFGHRHHWLAIPRRAVLVALALASVYVIWGSTYLAISVLVAEAPPMLTMAARFLLAGSILFALTSRRGDRIGDRVTLRHLGQATITGGILLVGGTGLVTLAQTRISSGLAALLVATVPLFLAVFARIRFGERLSRRAVLGLLVGLAGIAVLVDPGGGQFSAILLALAGAAGWAGGSMRSRRMTGPRRPMVAASLEMLGASLVFAIVGLLLGEGRQLGSLQLSTGAWFAFGYLTVAGSLVAYTAYSWLLRNVSTTVVGTYAYVNPVVAVLLGWLVLGEVIGPRSLAAGALVLASVVLLVTGRPGEPVPAQPTSGADVFAGRTRWDRRRRTTRVGSGSQPRGVLAAPSQRHRRTEDLPDQYRPAKLPA